MWDPTLKGQYLYQLNCWKKRNGQQFRGLETSSSFLLILRDEIKTSKIWFWSASPSSTGTLSPFLLILSRAFSSYLKVNFAHFLNETEFLIVSEPHSNTHTHPSTFPALISSVFTIVLSLSVSLPGFWWPFCNIQACLSFWIGHYRAAVLFYIVLQIN